MSVASPDDTAVAPPDYPMPREAGCPFDPPAALRGLTCDAPVARVRIWDGSTPWLVTGHAEQRALLADPRVSVDDRRPGFPHWNEGMAASVEQRPQTVFTSDPPEHGRFRRMLTRGFTVRRVEALRPRIQQLTDDLIDAMLAGPQPADLVTALALPMPSMVISELLGVPYGDHEFFQHHAAIGIDRDATPAAQHASMTALTGYLARLIEVKQANPAEDLVSDLAERVRDGELGMAEAAILGVGVLIAGHETTANMIALGALALLQNPAQLSRLRDTQDPAEVASAVEELLRYLGLMHSGLRRVAVDDIELAGVTIRAGEGIIVDLPAANWDPRAFPDPDRLDLARPVRQHHAFGFGAHQCLGQQLARVELQVVHGTLYRRIPTLRLAADVNSLEFKHDRLAYGVYALPVTW